MRLYKLADIGKIVSGSTPKTGIDSYWNGNIPWVTPKEISILDGPYLNDTERKITEEGYKSCSTSLLPKGSILFSSRAPIGLVAIANIEVCTNQGFKSIVLNNGFYPLYIYYVLKYNSRRLQSLGVGTTFLELSKSRFEEFEIPIPDYFSQIKIATVLSKAEILLKQRKESIDLLEEFLKSMFLKMFGDSTTNKKGWKKQALEELVAEDCPVTYGIVQPGDDYPNGVPIVRPMDLTGDKLSMSGLKLINPEISKKFKRTILKGNEILLCVRGTTGAISFATDELAGCNVTRGITPIWFSRKMSRLFAFYLLKSDSIQNEISKKTYGSALRQINLSDVRKLKMINPPATHQKKFTLIAERVQLLKFQFNDSLIDLENLYASLSQRAFKGELDLSAVEIDETLLPDKQKVEPVMTIPPGLQKAIELSDKINKQFEGINKITKITSGLSKQMEQFSKLQNQFKSIPKLPEALLQAQKNIERIQEATGKAGITEAPIEEETGFNWAVLANRIKERYKSRHFNFEMLHSFIQKDKLAEATPYYASEELKANPRLNDAEDLKSFIQTAIQNIEMDEKQQRQTNPFLRLTQSFYNAEEENFTLSLHKEDFKLIKDKTARQRSGIYFSLATEA